MLRQEPGFQRQVELLARLEEVVNKLSTQRDLVGNNWGGETMRTLMYLQIPKNRIINIQDRSYATNILLTFILFFC